MGLYKRAALEAAEDAETVRLLAFLADTGLISDALAGAYDRSKTSGKPLSERQLAWANREIDEACARTVCDCTVAADRSTIEYFVNSGGECYACAEDTR